MRYPIPPEEVKEEDLTKTARQLYRPLRTQGFCHEKAMEALHAISRACGVRYVPDLHATRSRAAKRKARVLLARGETDWEVQKQTGLSERTIGRLKRDLDEEVGEETVEA
jgi:uncharacterized protein YerC